MIKRYKIAWLLGLAVLLGLTPAFAQQIKSAGKAAFAPFEAGVYNFNSFTLHATTPSKEWLENNKDYTHHPDAGFLTPDNPTNAIELIAKRTADSRYFINKDSAFKFYIIKSNIDINYQKDKQWLSIDKRLCPKGNGTFEASHQQEPVGFDATKKTSYINTFSGPVSFNNWELLGQKGNDQTVLAIADWTHLSAGDDGLKITNVFPGIDAEMIVDRGSIKTSFIVRENQFKGYDQLIFTDEFKTPQLSRLVFAEATNKSGVDLIEGQKKILHIGSATMFVEQQPSTTTELLSYQITGDKLSMLVGANDLDAKLATGTVVIDPQVKSADSIALTNIGGSMNNGDIGNSCNYLLQMTTPAKATFTEVAFQFGFNTYLPANNSMGFVAIGLGACNTGAIGASPFDTGYTKPGYASTMGKWADISSYLMSCLPPPACTPQNVTFSMAFFNDANFGPDSVCSDQYVSPHEAFQMLIVGETLELNSVSPTAQICESTPTTIAATAKNGVPLYTYSWDHGAGTDSSVTVSPATTTTYTITITDQCGNKVTASTQVNVTPTVTPVVTISTSDTTICGGTQVVFTAVGSGGGPNPVYQWMVNGIDVGANSTTYTSNTLSNGDKVSCVLISNAICKASQPDTSNTITMAVTTPVTPSVTITPSANNVCGETPITFTAIPVNVGPAPSYQWEVSGLDKGPNDSLYTTDSLLDGDIVDCKVTVSNTGCYTAQSAVSNQVMMIIKAIPAIVLTASDTVFAKGNSTNLDAIITGGYTGFTWMPVTALSDTTITNPVASPVVSTTYTIKATNVIGCSKIDSIFIGVYDPIFIPSAFTPDANINNLFRVPPTINFDLTHFVVYNRWGQKVFETSDITQGWDGRYEGNNCDPGSYVYIITGSNAKGKVFVKGSVTLFR